jgi:hypothetical protein
MGTPELRIRLGRDGRIECRQGAGDDAPALSLDPAFFGEAGSADAQRALGRFVFSLLQGLPPADATEAEAPEAVQPNPDSPGALYEQFVTLQTRAMKEYSAQLLGVAEQSLQKSAAAGFAPAIDAMKDWPSIKMVADMLIARGPQD